MPASRSSGPRPIHLDLGVPVPNSSSTSRWLKASMARRTISTFSCDIARAVSRSSGVGVNVLLGHAEVSERLLATEYARPGHAAASDVDETSSHVPDGLIFIPLVLPRPLQCSSMITFADELEEPASTTNPPRAQPFGPRADDNQTSPGPGAGPSFAYAISGAPTRPRVSPRTQAESTLDDLHVLLRHRPRSIPQAQESA